MVFYFDEGGPPDFEIKMVISFEGFPKANKTELHPKVRPTFKVYCSVSCTVSA